jgi:hypothetical protein
LGGNAAARPYTADRYKAEQILLDVTRKHTVKIAEMSEKPLQELEPRYAVKRSELEDCVYLEAH